MINDMRTIEISIVIPVINEAGQVKSLISQIESAESGYIKEIIVVDGGSTDRTVEIASEAGARVVRSARGRAVQMNSGAKKATGDLLYFLHADTRPPPGFDREIIRSYQSGYGYGCFRLEFDWKHPLLRLYSFFTRFRTIWFRFGDQSLFVEKELFARAGGFDENLIVMEDQKIFRDLHEFTEYYLSESSVVTSARRYREVGPGKLQAIFFCIWLGYYLGVSQEVLQDIYKSLISA